METESTAVHSSVGADSAAQSFQAVAPASILDAWIAFDLDKKRAELEEEGLRIAARQDASAESRKTLAASTRNFKKTRLAPAPLSASAGAPVDSSATSTVTTSSASTPSDPSKAFTALLKEYQSEVDALTTRAKAAEAAFLALYKALSDVPDPVPELKHAASDKSLNLQLREELRVLRTEHSGLAEQNAAMRAYEHKIADLESQLNHLSARSASETKIALEQTQAKWEATQRQTVEAYELREQELLHELSVANQTLRAQHASFDTLKQQRDDAVAALDDFKKTRRASAEMQVEDSGRALAQVNELRRRCAQLEAQVAILSDEPASDNANALLESTPARSGSIPTRSALSAELATRDVEIAQLKDQVAALEEVLSSKDQAKSSEFARLAAVIQSKNEQVAELTSAIEKLPTLEEYQTMKRQFDALQEFQLNDFVDDKDMSNGALEDVNESGLHQAGNETNANLQQPRPAVDLEKRLLGKLKIMESRMTSMRVELSAKEVRIEEMSSLVQSLEEQNSDQKALIAKLEDGISAMTLDPSNARVLKARLTTATRLGIAPDSVVGESATPQSSTYSEGLDENNAVSAWEWGEQQQAAGLHKLIHEEPTMLDIVAGQRDRFRARTLELEEENRKVAERLEHLTTDMDSMRNDNVRMYEKIRYLQSYNESGTNVVRGAGTRDNSVGSVTSASAAGGSSVVIGVEDDDPNNGFLNKYRSIYEDMINPYALFNRRERHKRLNEMSAPERLTLRASQRALSTKTSRLIVFFYILGLHLFVFIVLGFSSTYCAEAEAASKLLGQ